LALEAGIADGPEESGAPPPPNHEAAKEHLDVQITTSIAVDNESGENVDGIDEYNNASVN
jgi:hypothetical protein